MPNLHSFLLASSVLLCGLPLAAQAPGSSAQQVQDDGFQIRLQYANFDPLHGEPPVAEWLSAPAGSQLHLVQFRAEIREAYRAAVGSTGAEIHHYLPYKSYLVRMTEAQRTQVQALPDVRSVLKFHPAYKLQPDLREEIESGIEIPVRRYDVVLVDRLRDEARVTAAISQLGGDVVTRANGNILLEAELSVQQLLGLLQDDGVLWIQRWGAPSTDMDNARIQGGANYIETTAGYRGRGIRGHIMEGIYPTHTEFIANAWRSTPIGLFNTTGTSHGNSTFGIIFARGASAQAKGLMPDGQGLFTNYNYVFNNANRYTLVRDLSDPALAHKAMFQTASWGYPQNQIYDARSAEMDRIIFDHDMPITQSQSNTGNQNSRPQAWAKNIISVGALNHYNTASPDDDRWTRASIGPAPDGRIKPDLCAYYDQIYTTSSATGYTATFGGTSGATPIVAGHLGLAIEMFTDGLFGYPAAPTWTDRFGYRAHSTTMKALLIATARQYIPAINGNVTRYQQGFGFPNLQTMYDQRDQMLVINELDVLLQGQARNYWVYVRPSTPQFKTTMIYNDLEAAVPTSGPHRVNNLDLKVVSPNYETYHGNVGLQGTGIFSTPGGVPNNLDTVENVFVQNPQGGLWQIEVSAPLIAQDGRVETPIVDADYALVAAGIGGGRDRSGATCDLTSSGPGNLQVALATLPGSYSFGVMVYSATTNRPLGTGNFLGLELDLLSLACLNMAPASGSPFAFTSSTTQFPAVAYTFPAPVALALSGLTLDGVSIFFGSGGNVVEASNVSRVTLP